LIHDFIMKVLGAGIAAVIYFLPLAPRYDGGVLAVDAHLTAPVTADTRALVLHGFEFRVDYYCSVIVNDRKAYSSHVINVLAFDETWTLNGSGVPEEEVQKRMGTALFAFPDVPLAEGDEVLLFVKAVILPDSTFQQSTGLSTRVLWNHYVPRRKEARVLRSGVLERR
jgi:hypothetical protein